ncbi:MAG: hypothetical protein E7122_00515 [Bacteroidales bacterium]|nr:hypothetical protein [Bacteroidales bacterium]
MMYNIGTTMMMKRYIHILVALGAVFCTFGANAQERVYVSTDKECYIAGEPIWFSVYCMADDKGGFSSVSKVAYLELHTSGGVFSTVKVALKEGRGCGRMLIPLTVPTGNCSIVSYTGLDGGNSTEAFAGKIITIFNTLSSAKVPEGVEIVPSDLPVKGDGVPQVGSNVFSVDVQKDDTGIEGAFPVSIRNLSDKGIRFSVSIYHNDELNSLVGEWGYNNTSLLERRGGFSRSGRIDYAGEVIKAKITGRDNAAEQMDGKLVYMSAMGNTDDIYVASANGNGVVTFYTNNIYGTRDLVFEVVGDTSKAYDVEILKPDHIHKSVPVPVLKISPKMREALLQRSTDMQIARRFEADTLFNLMEMRETSFIGNVQPHIYNLDDYTRFPVMEEVIREYVKDLRVRKEGGETVLRILWDTRAKALVLLDGVPVLDHSAVVGMDPLLVRQIAVYPRRYVLNNLVYDGIVKFNTYKNDMGGIKLGRNVSIETHKGVEYPLAFLGDGVLGKENYPNFNSTIYWNPTAEIGAGETFGFYCAKPQYKGAFRMVIEGIDSQGKEVFFTTTFNL